MQLGAKWQPGARIEGAACEVENGNGFYRFSILPFDL